MKISTQKIIDELTRLIKLIEEDELNTHTHPGEYLPEDIAQIETYKKHINILLDRFISNNFTDNDYADAIEILEEECWL